MLSWRVVSAAGLCGAVLLLWAAVASAQIGNDGKHTNQPPAPGDPQQRMPGFAPQAPPPAQPSYGPNRTPLGPAPVRRAQPDARAVQRMPGYNADRDFAQIPPPRYPFQFRVPPGRVIYGGSGVIVNNYVQNNTVVPQEWRIAPEAGGSESDSQGEADSKAGKTLRRKRDVLAADDKFVDYMNDGAAAFAVGKYAEARRQFSKAAQLRNADRADAELACAIAEFAMGNERSYTSAATRITKVIRERPELAQADFSLADRYRKAGDLDEQIEKLRRYVRLHPQSTDALVLLGFVEQFTGQKESARQRFAEVAKRRPNDEVAKAFLADGPATQPAADGPAAAWLGTGKTAAPTTRPAEGAD